MTEHYDISRLRKCPKCGSRNYETSLPISNWKKFKDGRLINWRKERYDAGSFDCSDCNFHATY